MGGSGGGYTRNHGVNVGGEHISIGNSHYHGRSHSSSSSSSCCNVFSCAGLTVVLVIFVLVMVFVGLSFSSTYTMTRCEQVVVCPSGALKDGHGIKFTPHSARSPLVASLVPGLPLVSAGFNETSVEHDREWMSKDRFEYDSFHLVAGSVVVWDIYAEYGFTFYLLRGRDNYQNFVDGKDFKYIARATNVARTNDKVTVEKTDEYFAVVYAEWYPTWIYYRNYLVGHTRYVVEDNVLEQTNVAHTFAVNKSLLPGACLIVEFPCKADWTYSDQVRATVAYELDNHALVIACAVIISLLAAAIVVSIIVCLVCTCRQSKGSEGQVYQKVPDTTAQPAPYPAGNQPASAPYAPQPGYAPPAYGQPSYPPAY